jgi:hypothetical protein
MKAYGGVDVQIHIFLTSALAGGEWSTWRPWCFTPGETAPGVHWLGGWVVPKVGLDDVEKRKFLTLPGLELRSLGRLASSQSLYLLRYPGYSLFYFFVTYVKERYPTHFVYHFSDDLFQYILWQFLDISSPLPELYSTVFASAPVFRCHIWTLGQQQLQMKHTNMNFITVFFDN